VVLLGERPPITLQAARGVRPRGLGVGSGLSARGMVVPLGRNPPPPEVLLQQGAQIDWMPAPDTIDPPASSDTMLALVAEQIGKMNVLPQDLLRGCFLH